MEEAYARTAKEELRRKYELSRMESMNKWEYLVIRWLSNLSRSWRAHPDDRRRFIMQYREKEEAYAKVQ